MKAEAVCPALWALGSLSLGVSGDPCSWLLIGPVGSTAGDKGSATFPQALGCSCHALHPGRGVKRSKWSTWG